MDSSEAETKRNRISKAHTNLGQYYTSLESSISKHNDVSKYNEDDHTWKGAKADIFKNYAEGYLNTLYNQYESKVLELIDELQRERDHYENIIRGVEDE